MAHYMPWYQTPSVSGYWGWHWTMEHFDPSKTDENGRPDIASYYLPLTGPYDSSDDAMLEYQVLLMKLSGIDGVIVDWYGMEAFWDYAVLNESTHKLFDYIKKAGLRFAICYEDQTIKHMVDNNHLPVERRLHTRASRDGVLAGHLVPGRCLPEGQRAAGPADLWAAVLQKRLGLGHAICRSGRPPGLYHAGQAHRVGGVIELSLAADVGRHGRRVEPGAVGAVPDGILQQRRNDGITWSPEPSPDSRTSTKRRASRPKRAIWMRRMGRRSA